MIDQFKQLESVLEPHGGRINLDTLSPSGQCVNAVLPVAGIDDLEDQLSKQDVRVNLTVDVKVVE